MAKQVINVGTAGDASTGDTLFDAFTKAKGNFDELYPVLSRPFLQVSGGGQNIGAAFTTVALSTVAVDNKNGFNTGTNIYVVPETGVYLVIGKIRFADNQNTIFGYGLGMDKTNADNPEFQWYTSSNAPGTARQGALNSRMMMLNQGDQLRMYCYVDGGERTVTASAMSCLRVL